ncbi:hypothetical protein Cni_G08182 [Canna indica]|uniref:Myb/SANT-like domain-containing protein n=1 Tax=Canna indica TaxID=4628 RepID=A0AAQ3K5D3_9LILI|nr:hypothetical protein Cni_G08182 [Canna indica]
MDTDGIGSQGTTQNRIRGKKHRWTPEQDAALIDCMLDLKNDPFWSAGEGNNFKPEFLNQLEKMLEAKLPGCGIKAHPQIHSRHKLLKTQYNAIYDMLHQSSGFGWDPNRCCVTCHQDVWDQWVKSHPNASGLQNKSFPHLDSLSIIFGKDRATRERAEDPTDSSASILREVVNLDEEVPLGSPEGVEIDSLVAQPSANNTQNRSTSGHT